MIGEISRRKTPKLVVPFLIARLGLPFIKAFAMIKNEHPLYTKEPLDILKNSPRIYCQRKSKT